MAFSEIEKHMTSKQKITLYNIVENPKSVFCYVFPYYAGLKKGNISIYARGRDYHAKIGEVLNEKAARMSSEHLGYKFIPLIDASPLPEVTVAALSGYGVIGENGLLIHPEYGSYCFIGCIISDFATNFNINSLQTCDKCGACVCICPTNALSGGRINVGKCLSHITQKRGKLNDFEREAVQKSESVWGCDLCQIVCPKNKNVKICEISDFTQNLIENFEISEIIPLSAKEFKRKYPGRAFTWRGVSPIKRNLILKSERASE